MNAKCLHVFTGLWLLSALMHAQSGMAGRWTTEGAPGGAATIVLQLTVKGSVVDGTITLGENPTQAVSDGKTEGNNVTFKTVAMMNGKEVPMVWEGHVQENKLTLTRSIGSNKLATTVLQRSK